MVIVEVDTEAVVLCDVYSRGVYVTGEAEAEDITEKRQLVPYFCLKLISCRNRNYVIYDVVQG